MKPWKVENTENLWYFQHPPTPAGSNAALPLIDEEIFVLKFENF